MPFVVRRRADNKFMSRRRGPRWEPKGGDRGGWSEGLQKARVFKRKIDAINADLPAYYRSTVDVVPVVLALLPEIT